MRKYLLALVAAAPLSTAVTAAGHAAGGGTVIVTSSHEYTRCIASGGDEYYEDGDDIRICEYTSGHWAGSQIWCDADFGDCEFVTVPPSVPPDSGSQVNTDAGTTTQVQDGGFGGTGSVSSGIQLQIER